MNCVDFLEHIDDLHAGALAPDLRAAADAHLAACRNCQAEYAGLRQIHAARARLPAEVMPARDLWPGVAARLAARPETTRPSGLVQYALAATVMLAVGGMAALVFRAAPEGVTTTLAAAPAQQLLAEPRGRAEFVAHLAVEEGSLTPETRAVVLHNLRVIETALAEIEQAMDRDPNDPNVRALLTRIHQQESALIDQVQRISMNHAKRTDI